MTQLLTSRSKRVSCYTLARMIDPIKLSKIVEEEVVRNGMRKYFRFRGGRWYGGIATGDVVGCNLSCGFCWGWRVRDNVRSVGFFVSVDESVRRLVEICRRRGYKLVRLSGGEPTIGFSHMIEVARKITSLGYTFILETNGILIGYYKELADELASLSNVVVRVSLKGCNPSEFSMLTLAPGEYFEYQLKALENLLRAGLEPGREFYPAVMVSFSSEDSFRELVERLSRIHPVLAKEIDIEYVILYRHVKEILRKRGLRPRYAVDPSNIPSEMI